MYDEREYQFGIDTGKLDDLLAVLTSGKKTKKEIQVDVKVDGAEELDKAQEKIDKLSESGINVSLETRAKKIISLLDKAQKKYQYDGAVKDFDSVFSQDDIKTITSLVAEFDILQKRGGLKVDLSPKLYQFLDYLKIDLGEGGGGIFGLDLQEGFDYDSLKRNAKNAARLKYQRKDTGEFAGEKAFARSLLGADLLEQSYVDRLSDDFDKIAKEQEKELNAIFEKQAESIKRAVDEGLSNMSSEELGDLKRRIQAQLNKTASADVEQVAKYKEYLSEVQTAINQLASSKQVKGSEQFGLDSISRQAADAAKRLDELKVKKDELFAEFATADEDRQGALLEEINALDEQIKKLEQAKNVQKESSKTSKENVAQEEKKAKAKKETTEETKKQAKAEKEIQKETQKTTKELEKQSSVSSDLFGRLLKFQHNTEDKDVARASLDSAYKLYQKYFDGKGVDVGKSLKDASDEGLAAAYNYYKALDAASIAELSPKSLLPRTIKEFTDVASGYSKALEDSIASAEQEIKRRISGITQSTSEGSVSIRDITGELEKLEAVISDKLGAEAGKKSRLFTDLFEGVKKGAITLDEAVSKIEEAAKAKRNAEELLGADYFSDAKTDRQIENRVLNLRDVAYGIKTVEQAYESLYENQHRYGSEGLFVSETSEAKKNAVAKKSLRDAYKELKQQLADGADLSSVAQGYREYQEAGGKRTLDDLSKNQELVSSLRLEYEKLTGAVKEQAKAQEVVETVAVDSKQEERVAERVAEYKEEEKIVESVSSSEATNLGQIVTTLELIIRQIGEKTQAFREEDVVVESVVSNEVSNLMRLSSVLTEIAEQLRGLNSIPVTLSVDTQNFATGAALISSVIRELDFGDTGALNTINQILKQGKELKALASILSESAAKLKQVKTSVGAKDGPVTPEEIATVDAYLEAQRQGIEYDKEQAEYEKGLAEIEEQRKQTAREQIKLLEEAERITDKQDDDRRRQEAREQLELLKQAEKIDNEIAKARDAQAKQDAKEATQLLREVEKAKQEVEKAQQKEQTKQIDTLDKQEKAISSYLENLKKYQNAEKYMPSVVSEAKDVQNIVSSFNRETMSVEELAKAFKNAESAYSSFTSSVKSRGKADLVASANQIAKFNLRIEEFIGKNSAMGKELAAEFRSLKIPDGALLSKEGFDQAFNACLRLEEEVQRLGLTGRGAIDSILNRVKQMSTNFISMYFSLYDIIRYIRTITGTVTELDSALTELRKVSDASTLRLEQSFEKSAQTAKELGATITDVINATADWARMGYDVTAAEELARVTTLYENVGDGISQEEASESLISTLQGYQLAYTDAERVIDKFNDVSNNFAITSGGIGEALQRSAAAFNAANTDLSESIALIAGANEIVQDVDSVGHMWTTVSARIRGASIELEKLGEESDEYVNSTSKLRNTILGITGVDIMENESTYKDIYEIVTQIAEKWNEISDIDQAALLEALAGKRQANRLAATITNIDRVKEAYETAEKSQGSAQREQENYMKSIQYSLDVFTATWQELQADLLDSGLTKEMIDFATTMVSAVDSITKATNGWGLAIAGLSAGYYALARHAGKEADRRQSVLEERAYTEAIRENTSALKENLAVRTGQATAESAENGAIATNTGEVAENTIVTQQNTGANLQNEAADIAGATSEGVKTGAIVTNTAVTETNTASIFKNITAMKLWQLAIAHPFGSMLVFTAILAGIAVVLKSLPPSFDENIDKLDELNDQAENHTKELESYNEELKETRSRLDELEDALNGDKHLSIVDQEELEELKETNEELERNIALEKEQARSDVQEGLTTARKAAKQKGSRYWDGSEYNFQALDFAMEDNIRMYNEVQKQIDELTASYNAGEISVAEYDKELGILTGRSNEIRSIMSDYYKQIEEINSAYKNAASYVGEDGKYEMLTVADIDTWNSYKSAANDYLELIGMIQEETESLASKQRENISQELIDVFGDQYQASFLDNMTDEQIAYLDEHLDEFIDSLLKRMEELKKEGSESYQYVLDEIQRGIEEGFVPKDFKFGDELAEVVIGNIDTAQRQVLEWNKKNVAKYKDALLSWGENPWDYLGSYSTVDSMSDNWDGVEIAFTPIFIGEDGPEFLDSDTVISYIDGLVEEANRRGLDWQNDESVLLGLDSKDNGGKGLLFGQNLNGAEAASHYAGSLGSISMATKDAKKEMDAYTLSVDTFMDEFNRLLDVKKTAESGNLFDILGTEDLSKSITDFTSNVNSAYSAYQNLLHGNISADSFISSLIQISEAAKAMGGSLNMEWILSSADSMKLLGDSIDYVAEKYAQSVLSDTGIDSSSTFGQALATAIEESYRATNQLSALNTEIDNLQSSYNDLNEVIETYNQNGYITFDQLQTLLAMEPQYLACLIDEGGQLALNEQTMLNLANARLNDAEAQAVQQATSDLASLSLQQESEAARDTGVAFDDGLSSIASYNLALANLIPTTSVAASAIRELNAAVKDEEAKGADKSGISNVLNNLQARLKLIQATRAGLKNGLGNIMGGSKSSSSSSKDEDPYVKAYEKELEALDKLHERGKITERDYLNQLRALYEKYFKGIDKYAENFAEAQKAYLDKILSYFNSGISAAQNILDRQTDDLNKQKEAIEKSYQKQIDAINDIIDGIDDSIDGIQDQIDAINDAADARKRELDIQKAQYNLLRAQEQHTKMVYKDGQLVYETDTSAVRDAREELDNAVREKQVADLQKQIDALEDQKDAYNDNIDALEKLIDKSNEYYDGMIEKLDAYKDRWKELGELQDRAGDIAILAEMGISVEDILSMSDAAFNEFKNNYVGVLADLNTGNTTFLDSLKTLTGENPLPSFLEKTQNVIDSLIDKDWTPVLEGLDGTASSAESAASAIEDVVSAINGGGDEDKGSGDKGSSSFKPQRVKMSADTGGTSKWTDGKSNGGSGLVGALSSVGSTGTSSANAVADAVTDVMAPSIENATSLFERFNEIAGKYIEKQVTINISTKNQELLDTYFKKSPSHASGTDLKGLRSAEKNALRSEFGQPELTVYPNGSYEITDRPTISDLPKGTVIYDEKKTKKILDGKGGFSGVTFADGTTLTPVSSAQYDIPKSITNIEQYVEMIRKNVVDMADVIVDKTGGALAARNRAQSVRPNITISGTSFTVTGVTGEQVLKQIQGQFEGLMLNAYQSVMSS